MHTSVHTPVSVPVPVGFDYCMNSVSALMCVFLCVCAPVGSLPVFPAPSTSLLIGLQRGSWLAGGWAADHTDDPSLPPPKTLREATVTCPPFTIPPSIHPLIPESVYSSPRRLEAPLTRPTSYWCPSFPFLSLFPCSTHVQPAIHPSIYPFIHKSLLIFFFHLLKKKKIQGLC